jgi:hypothetical protein
MRKLRSKLVCLFGPSQKTLAYYGICPFPENYKCFIVQAPEDLFSVASTIIISGKIFISAKKKEKKILI